MQPALSHIDNWIFDLDNTLYPPECALFELIDTNMRNFISNLLSVDHNAAHKIQKNYFRDHGTTLAGLMAHNDVDPHQFLDYVHDIEMDRLTVAPRLRDHILALQGRKIIFTNGDAPYANRILAGLGLDDLFDDICDIHDMQYQPKPHDAAYQALLRNTGINPERSLFVEDMARNLAPAKKLGMTTIWVNNGSEYGSRESDLGHIDYQIFSVADWLQELTSTSIQ